MVLVAGGNAGAWPLACTPFGSSRNTNTPLGLERESMRAPRTGQSLREGDPLSLEIDFVVLTRGSERSEAQGLVERRYHVT